MGEDMGARRQLAKRRRALGYSQERLAEVLGADRVTIGRWERGETDPQPYLRPRLAKALQTSAAELEALLSPEDDRPAPVPPKAVSTEAHGAHAEVGYLDDMIRREFLRLVTLTGALVTLSPDDAGQVPVEEVAEAQVMTSHLWQVYSLARAKRTVYPLVRDQISELNRVLGSTHREVPHRELCGQAGNLFQLAGEIFFDGNRYTEAAECYLLAASASKEAGDADLWAASLTRHSFIGVYERRFREAAPMLDAAGLLARKGDSHLSTRYWVAAVQAQVYAGLGDLDACNRALDQAQEVHHLNDPSPGGWLRFDGSRLDEERGSCYVTLGRLDLAEAALTDALGRKLSMRRQGSVLTDLAVIGARRQDVDRLLSYGTAALELAERTSSGYIGRKLEGLRGHLVPFLPDKRVTDFNDRISSLTAA
jgi:transcriptional regulator with XRE-family HTH domain